MGLNVAVLALMVLSGVSPFSPTGEHLLNWGANFGPYTLGGEWWRLLTSTFVHIGIIHLALNMQCLWRLGNLTERLFGNWAFLLLYILSGLGGSIVSLWWNPNTIGAGASGAIFGIAGGLAVFLCLTKLPVPRAVIQGALTSTLLFVGYNLLYGFTSSGIDNAAHIGGLVTGAVVGALLSRPLPPSKTHSRLRNSAVAIGLVLLLIVATVILRKSDSALAGLMRAEDLLEAGKFDQAIMQLEDVLESDPDNAVAHLLLGNAYAQAGAHDDAIASYTRAISLDSQLTEAYRNRGITYAMKDQRNEALADLNRSIELGANDAYVYYVRGILRAVGGEREAAILDLEKALELGLEPGEAETAGGMLEELRGP
jgi:rhomboid protease GluP